MKTPVPFLIATLVCVPFLVLIPAYLAVFILGDRCPDVIFATALNAMFLLTTRPVLLIVPLSALVGAWLQRSKTAFEFAATATYSIVIFLHIAYVGWWHATGGWPWDL
jgi:hypothetical protein